MTDAAADSSSPPLAGVGFVALATGQTVGRYEIISVLGQGGFGITYRARDTRLDREVAIKEYLPSALAVRQGGTTVLPRSTDAAEDFSWGRERFVAEGRTLASLEKAPAIVRVFDFLEANGTAYIVMELVRGETVDHRLKRNGRLSADEIDRILWPLLDGLSRVHGVGFLHRDIKPANVLLDEMGAPTLIDFGASRAAMAGRSTAMTAIFTPGFAAAEQFTSAKQGPWTDIYGLSATLYNAITGRVPPSAFDRMLDDTYMPLASSPVAGFSLSLLAGIDAGLAVRAADRPQSIEAWRKALTQATVDGSEATVALRRPAVAAPQPSPAPSPPAEPPATKPASRRRTALTAGIAVLLLAAGSGGYFLYNGNSQRVALQDMKVEDLEKALEARRKADAEAAEKIRLEQEAQKQAAANAEAQKAAEEALAKAKQEREQAEADLARVKAELEAQKKAAAQQADAARRAAAEEAQKKAEAEAEARRQAEDDARRKAAAEADAKRRADEDLAKAQAEREQAEVAAKAKAEAEAKQKAEADAKVKAEAEARAKEKADAEAKAKAEADAKAKAEAEDKKKAEAAEAALKLAQPDRQRLQVALTSQGFDTHGSDGAFGPRTREMVAAWQKARNQPATGFLNAAQHQQLVREAAAALQKYDDDQKKADEEKKKAEEEAKKKAEEEAKAKAAATSLAGASAANLAQSDGSYAGTLNTPGGPRIVTVQVSNGVGTGKLVRPDCGSSDVSFKITPDGEISGNIGMFDNTCYARPGVLKGHASDGRLQIVGTAPGGSSSGTLFRGAAAPSAGSPPASAAGKPAGMDGSYGGKAGTFDGSYGGSLTINKLGLGGGGSVSVAAADLTIAGGSATGQITIGACGAPSPVKLSITTAGQISGTLSASDGPPLCNTVSFSAGGSVRNGVIQLELRGAGASAHGTLRRGVAAAAPSAVRSTPAAPFDGAYEGQLAGTVTGGAMSGQTFYAAKFTIAGGRLVGTAAERKCGAYQIEATVAGSGEVSGQARFPDDAQCVATTATISGRVSGNVLSIEFRTPRGTAKGSLSRNGG